MLPGLDPTQIQQILLNLGVNARDAIGEAGTIVMEARERSLAPVECAGRASARPGRFVVFSVRDDGAGMDARTLERIFDPFFTTKPLGAGTGLGLAIVYGLVRANRGWIEVESGPGAAAFSGSGCRRRRAAAEEALPQAWRGARERAHPASRGRGAGAPRRASRPRARGLHRARGVRRPRAVEWLRSATEPPDLAVLDLSMPRMGGLEALAELRAQLPDLPVI
jgi:CheY-like chemotaxis protein